MTVRAAIYARYSTDKQSETSITDQLRVCRERAAAEGWSVLAEFADEGISGAAQGNRPGLQEFLRRQAEFDALLVISTDRLARSQELAPLIERLRFRGMRVIGVHNGFDSTSPTARMHAGLDGIISEEFRAGIRMKTHAAQETRAKVGMHTGGAVYGFQAKGVPDGAYFRRVVDDIQAAIVREIFDRYAKGDSMKSIASDLNRRGVPSPGAGWKRDQRRTDGKWLVSTVHTLLHNEVYAGRVVWNRSQWVKDPDSGKRIRRERPASEWVTTRIEPLIDAPVWAVVQSRLNRHKTTVKRGAQPKHILSGLLVCSICGAKFIVMGGSQSRYICGTNHAGGLHACNNTMTVPRKLVERLVLGPIKSDMLDPRRVRSAIKRIREMAIAEAKAETRHQANPAATRLHRQIAELEGLVHEGRLTPEVAEPALAKARAELAAIPAVVAVAPRRVDVERVAAKAEESYRFIVNNVERVLAGDEETGAREVFRRSIGAIVLMPDGDHLTAVFRRHSDGEFVEAALDGSMIYKLVAGAGFEPATFGL